MMALYSAHTAPQGTSELQPAQVLPQVSLRTHRGHLTDLVLVSSVAGLILRKDNVW